MQGGPEADPRVHPHRVPGVVLVDVDHLAALVSGQVHGLAGAGVQFGEVRRGDPADPALFQGEPRECEQTGAQVVAVSGVAVDESFLFEALEQPEHGRLVHTEHLGQLVQGALALTEFGEDAQGAGDGLAHGAPRAGVAAGRGSGAPPPGGTGAERSVGEADAAVREEAGDGVGGSVGKAYVLVGAAGSAGDTMPSADTRVAAQASGEASSRAPTTDSGGSSPWSPWLVSAQAALRWPSRRPVSYTHL